MKVLSENLGQRCEEFGKICYCRGVDVNVQRLYSNHGVPSFIEFFIMMSGIVDGRWISRGLRRLECPQQLVLT